MLRLKILNRGLSNLLIAGLLISSPANAAQTGTGNVRGSHDSSGQNANGGSFLPNDVTNDVPLPHYCLGSSPNNTSTWLDNGQSCCGQGTTAANAACSVCQAPPAPGVAGVITGSWTAGGLNGAIIGGGACCGTGTGDSAQNQPCPDVCTGSTFPIQSGNFNNSGGLCCNTSATPPAAGGTTANGGAVATNCADDPKYMTCNGSVPAQGLTGNWSGTGTACCGSGIINTEPGGTATDGACPAMCSGSGSTSGTWMGGANAGQACCGTGSAATSGVCAPTCNGSATIAGNWSDNSGQCCGSGSAAQGASNAINGVCGGGPGATCNNNVWSNNPSACCMGSGATATSVSCGSIVPNGVPPGYANPTGPCNLIVDSNLDNTAQNTWSMWGLGRNWRLSGLGSNSLGQINQITGDGPSRGFSGQQQGMIITPPITVVPGTQYRLSMNAYQSYGWIGIRTVPTNQAQFWNSLPNGDTSSSNSSTLLYVAFENGGNDINYQGHNLSCEMGGQGVRCGSTSGDTNGNTYYGVPTGNSTVQMWGLWTAPAGVTQVEIQMDFNLTVQNGGMLAQGFPTLQPPFLQNGIITYANTYIPGPPTGASACNPIAGAIACPICPLGTTSQDASCGCH